MRQRQPQAGFTLLELLVVLVLAGITAAVVGGGAQSFMERSRYHQVVRDVASQLSRARALCVQDGRSVVVTYQPESRQLIVDGTQRLEIPEPLVVRWTPVQRIGQKADPALGQPVFVFNADGGAVGGQFTVARGTQGVVFRVNWLLGTVEQAVAAVS